MSKWEARWLEATEAGSDYLQRIVSHFEPQEEPAQYNEQADHEYDLRREREERE